MMVCTWPVEARWTHEWSERGSSQRLLWLTMYALILSCENWGPLHALTNLWLKAAATLAFGGIMILDVVAGRDPLGLKSPRAEGA